MQALLEYPLKQSHYWPSPNCCIVNMIIIATQMHMIGFVGLVFLYLRFNISLWNLFTKLQGYNIICVAFVALTGVECVTSCINIASAVCSPWVLDHDLAVVSSADRNAEYTDIW